MKLHQYALGIVAIIMTFSACQSAGGLHTESYTTPQQYNRPNNVTVYCDPQSYREYLILESRYGAGMTPRLDSNGFPKHCGGLK